MPHDNRMSHINCQYAIARHWSNIPTLPLLCPSLPPPPTIKANSCHELKHMSKMHVDPRTARPDAGCCLSHQWHKNPQLRVGARFEAMLQHADNHAAIMAKAVAAAPMYKCLQHMCPRRVHYVQVMHPYKLWLCCKAPERTD